MRKLSYYYENQTIIKQKFKNSKIQKFKNSKIQYNFKLLLYIFLFAFLPVFSSSTFAQLPCDNLPTFDYTFNNQTLTNSLLLTNKNVRITGNVTFNGDVIFSGCNVLIDPGSVVTMKKVFFCKKSSSGAPTVIFGCSAMWKSIVIAPGASVKLFDSEIRDGEEALVFQNGYKAANSYIQRCTFNRNIIAIKASGVSNFSFVKFEGNAFKTSVVPSLLLPPQIMSTPVYGISVIGSTGSVGTAGASNTFIGFTAGISAVSGSVLNVNNCTFRFNQKTNSINPSHPGAVIGDAGNGISSKNSSIFISGEYADGYSCIFEGNNVDIISFTTNQLSVANASFLNPIKASIKVNNSTATNKVTLDDNQFTIDADHPLPTQNWVQIQRANQASGINVIVKYNHFDIAPPNAVSPNANSVQMLRFTAVGFPKDICQIFENVFDCRYGIPANNTSTRTIDAIRIFGDADGYDISNNHIFYNQGTAFADHPHQNVTNIGIGMEMNMGVKNQIINNDLHGVYFTGEAEVRQAWLRCGLHLSNTPKVKICNNLVEDATNHYHFLEDNSQFEFGLNTTQGAGNFGFKSDPDAPIPNNHDHRRNKWLGTYETRSAECVSPPTDLSWKADGSVAGQLPSATQPEDWFFDEMDDHEPKPCGGGQVLQDPDESTGRVTDNYINGVYNFSNDAAEKDFRMNLLRQLIRFPGALNYSNDVNNYYTGAVNSIPWQLADASWQIAAASYPPDNLEADLALITNALIEKSDSIRLLESMVSADPEVYDSLLHLQIANLIMSAHILAEQQNSICANIDGLRTAALNTIITDINSIAVTDDYEQFLKTLLLLSAQAANGQEWSDGEWQTIENIAAVCSETYGNSVFIARSLLPGNGAGYATVEEPDDACTRERTGLPGSGLDQIKEYLITPNPAKGVFTIQTNQMFSGTIRVFDLTGRLVNTTVSEKTNTVKMNCSGWSAGIYYISISPENGAVKTLRLVITD